MTIVFHTNKLNQKLYRQVITRFINTTFARDDVTDFTNLKEFIRTWNIIIYPSTMAASDPFFYGKEGVGGVTGNKQIKLYLRDETISFLDILQATFRANVVVISHEICHGILIYLGANQKVSLRNDDFGSNKKGTMLNFSTAEVHDRHTEGKFWTMRFWFWHLFIPRLLTTKVLEIRDLV